MRLDYSDKMTAVKEGVGRPVPKNRPRREPIGGFLLVALILMVIGYGGGVLTGWFLFKVKGGQPAPAPVAQQAKSAASSQPGAPVPPGGAAQPAPDVPLTFYKTLPSGGKGAMGSGINTKLPAIQPKSAPAADGASQVKPAPATAKEGEAKNAARSAEEKPAEKRGAEKPAEKQTGEPRFLVQVASYKNKQEAEAVHARLAAKGVAAYLVESKLQDKGVWYRIRVGRHLTREEAQQLAAKVGAGATVIAE